MSARLCGEVALITGGSRGIGLAIALEFAREGARVALVGRSAAQLANAEAKVREAGGAVLARQADVTDEAAMSAAIDDVRSSLGAITILVNNAGAIGPIGPFGESPLDGWWRCVEVNLRGPAVCTHLVIREMAASGRGRIINVVSGAATFSSTYYSAYGAAKTAVTRWTETIAAEFAAYGVKLFAMEPGTVVTAMSEHSRTSSDGRRWIPWFREIFDLGLDSPVGKVARRAADLAAGTADALSGCYIPMNEALEDLVANVSRIREEKLYSLRMSRLPQSLPANAALRALRERSEKASANVVRLGRELPLSAHEAFDLWRDGAAAGSWFLPANGRWLAGPIMERRAGGRFDLDLSAGDERFHLFGTVTSVVPDERLTLQWNWESDSPSLGSGSGTCVTVELLPVRGGTEVVITHDGLPGESVRDRYVRGWRRCLEAMNSRAS